jgi:ABC-type multidrug transport system fused ATPase/permease subunit
MLAAYRRLFAGFRGYGKLFILCQVLLLVSGASSIGLAAATQHVINAGLVAKDTDVIITTGIWMAVLAVVAGLTMAGAAAIAVFFMQGTVWGIRTEVYSKVQEYSFQNFDSLHSSNLLVRLSSDVDNVAWAVLYGTLLLFYAPFMAVIAFVLTLWQAPSMAWLLIAATVLVIALMAVIAPRIDKAYVERQKRLDDVNAALQESLAGVRVVKAFTREKLEADRFRQRATAMRHPAFTAAFSVALMQPLINVAAQATIMVALWYGGGRVLSGSLGLGELIAFTQYLSLVAAPLAILAIVVPSILRGGASIRRLLEAYDAVPAVQDAVDALAVEPAAAAGRVAFEDVSFAFRRADGELDPPVLKHVDLTIEPGERVGILGATGSGKTALVSLVPRFYDVIEGRVTIDGVDVRDLRQDDLRRSVGVALQEAVLFQGDIRFNLKFGEPGSDDDLMKDAAAAADAKEFVDRLPGSWDAQVARRGYNFSGGQRQRLSIARALLPRPRVLIFDDSTSALDVATEARVQAAIPEFAEGATTIYVAQRISAVIDLDKIVLLDEGRVADVGTHEELLERSPLYQDIYESQLGAGLSPQAAGGAA